MTSGFKAQPHSAHDAYRQFNAKYDAMIASGQYVPAVYPLVSVGVGAIIFFLLIDYRNSTFLRWLRLPVWLFNLAVTCYTIIYVRGRSPAAALGIGLLPTWFTIWTGAILVFEDCQTGYARIAKRPRVAAHEDSERVHTNGSAATAYSDLSSGGKTSARRSTRKANKGIDRRPMPSEEYYWQSYPSSFLSRLDWIVDLLSTFRGTGWTWRIGGMARIPDAVQASLDATSGERKLLKSYQAALVRTYATRSTVLRSNLYAFLRNYLVLDLIKTLMAHDPYFWGCPSTASPPTYLPPSLRSYPFLFRLCRIIICLGALKFGLDIIFRLGPLFYVGLLGPDVVSVRGEAWVNADMFGPLDAIFDKGLAGWWGTFWHQTFRRGFEAPGVRLVRALGLQPRSQPARLVQLFVAFGLSGLLHASGSMTQLGDTAPVRGPMVFFLSQAAGIALQMRVVEFLRQTGLLQRIPRRVRRWANFLFAHIWLYHFAWRQVDDFGAGGVWLFEPIPVSILRGPLGLGAEEDTWWQWGGGLVHWHKGKHWWSSGLTA